MKRNSFRTPELDQQTTPTRAAGTEEARPKVHFSDELLADEGQIIIIHRGQRYTLRETRSGKLILYK